jgi:hypothetical protein
MASFDIEISTTGEVIIKAEGFTGTKCLDTARGLLNELGNASINTNLAYEEETEREYQW